MYIFFNCVYVAYLRYNASDGKNSESRQPSGAYIFRPNSSVPFVINRVAKTETIQVQWEQNFQTSRIRKIHRQTHYSTTVNMDSDQTSQQRWP